MAINKIDPDKDSNQNASSATVVLECPTCNKRTPHKTKGVMPNEAFGGKLTRAMECSVCKTLTDVLTGEDGTEFQANVDATG